MATETSSSRSKRTTLWSSSHEHGGPLPRHWRYLWTRLMPRSSQAREDWHLVAATDGDTAVATAHHHEPNQRLITSHANPVARHSQPLAVRSGHCSRATEISSAGLVGPGGFKYRWILRHEQIVVIIHLGFTGRFTAVKERDHPVERLFLEATCGILLVMGFGVVTSVDFMRISMPCE